MGAPLRTKLQLAYAQRLEVVNPPPEVAGAVADLQGAEQAGVLVFVRTSDDVRRHAAALAAAAEEPSGLAWAAYPKRSSGVETDITRDRGWDALRDAGLRPVRQVAIDDTWSALRFRRPKHAGQR